MYDELKYRARLSTSIDKGLERALRELSLQTYVPISRLLDEALEALLKKRGVPYEMFAPYGRMRIEKREK